MTADTDEASWRDIRCDSQDLTAHVAMRPGSGQVGACRCAQFRLLRATGRQRNSIAARLRTPSPQRCWTD
ncbi:hypothetical protein XACJM35_240038 [Xanthomonas citri pv. citri]|nr:hypothetical protein XACJM35_240038 [Xanthomonas citri pv. citri]